MSRIIKNNSVNNVASKTPRDLWHAPADFEKRWPGADATASECVHALSRLISAMRSDFATLAAPYGISGLAALDLLEILYDTDGPVLPSVLAEQLAITRAGVTQMLGTLTRKKLIRRRSSHEDGRQWLVELTEIGREALPDLLLAAHQCEANICSALSSKEQGKLLDYLARLYESISSQSARHQESS